MRNEPAIEPEAFGSHRTEGQLLLGSYQDLPNVPALPETLLRMDLMMQEPRIDLREMSQLILSDLGATLQVLRLAGKEYGDGEGRPTRIVDCISDLGVEACVDAISAYAVARDGRKDSIAEFWAYSRQVATYSKQAAEEMTDGKPEEAYLAGLLHGLGSLPAVLGWDYAESGLVDGEVAGLRLAQRWSLPACVIELLFDIQLAEQAARRGVAPMPNRLQQMSSMH